ncbi:hypothetical protein NGR_b06880 (plasmid) [Sinorhizobium fredii NGR234]|uniref:Uncharacterized protein n=1 Tax=Sinorhizobium fredii (strain NBRC 101917 / NGR234) TaxID=394 RepID=C3KPY8_SINFN|nr:hypothetical protein NGR_b06880 [Sinorhizobium fredii NGR234]
MHRRAARSPAGGIDNPAGQLAAALGLRRALGPIKTSLLRTRRSHEAMTTQGLFGASVAFVILTINCGLGTPLTSGSQ